MNGAALAETNRTLLLMERAWLSDGLPGRPFYRSLFAAPDEDSGYAAWMLPGLRHVVAHGKPSNQMVAAYQRAFAALHEGLSTIDSLVAKANEPAKKK